MKKTRVIHLTLMATLASAFISGCEDDDQKRDLEPHNVEVQRCVDSENQVVDDAKCEAPSANVYPYYRWYYGGNGYYAGQTATGGSFSPSSGFSSVRTSSAEGQSVIRGGFGGGFGEGHGAVSEGIGE